MIKQTTANTHRRRGAALVEMALVLPVFVTVTLGIIEFGRAMMVSQLVTNAAREGARLGSLDGTTNPEIEAEIRSFLQGSANVGSGDVSIAITVTPAAGNPDPGNNVSNANVRDEVNIVVSIPFNAVSFIDGNYLAGKNITGSATMRHE
ncbi:MAG: TadE/TadG family type IV pilus assembly protein [Planctomycetaceae bacterium]